MGNELMIEAEGLAKRYGETRALVGVDFAVPAGMILGLLGPRRLSQIPLTADQ